MAATPAIANALAIVLCNAIVDALDAGAAAGTLEIRGTPGPPSTVDDAATGSVLATFTLSDPAFGAASDTNPGAAATAAAIVDVNASATGTAVWFRAYDSNGLAVLQGTCGTSAADCIMNTTSLISGNPVSVLSWIWRQREN